MILHLCVTIAWPWTTQRNYAVYAQTKDTRKQNFDGYKGYSCFLNKNANLQGSTSTKASFQDRRHWKKSFSSSCIEIKPLRSQLSLCADGETLCIFSFSSSKFLGSFKFTVQGFNCFRDQNSSRGKYCQNISNSLMPKLAIGGVLTHFTIDACLTFFPEAIHDRQNGRSWKRIIN